jgi:hypothetical protein
VNEAVPRPVLFNVWKHHAGFILDQIQYLSQFEDTTLISSNLKRIGTSTTDLYTGELGVNKACCFTIETLTQMGLRDKGRYLNWILEMEDHFREIMFPDSSVWILRIGIEPDRYIHLHPGRNTAHCRRVKANVLKTAIATCIQAMSLKADPFNIELINDSRKELCDLQPIRFITLNHELGQVINWFAIKLRLI